MATVSQNQNVANSPTNSYPVGIFKQANGTELQAVVSVSSTGVEYDSLNPLPVSGTFSASLASASTSTEGRVTAGASATVVLAANGARKGGRVMVSINSPEAVNISFGEAASASSPLYGPGSVISLADGAVKYIGAVSCFSAGASGVVEFVEL